MPLDDLARILAEMYENADRDKAATVHLFGIRYANEIRENEYSPASIISRARRNNGAQISEAYSAEINKGINLSRYVIEKETIVDFINNAGIN
jgi:hypothetical protein